MHKPYQTPDDEVLNRLKKNWTYKGRKPSTIRWDEGPYGGYLMMKFSDKPKVVVELASPILFSIEALRAIFPGKLHNPLCQWGDFGEYHISGDGKFSQDCLLDRANYEQDRLLKHTCREYMYLRSRLAK